MTGAPEGSPKVVLCGFFLWFFMEKPGIEPATPGLQGIALIHYTTGASGDLRLIHYTTIHLTDFDFHCKVKTLNT